MNKNIPGFQNRLQKTIFTFLITLFLLSIYSDVSAQQKEWMVRLAKIEVDTAYLEQYKAAIKEHIQAALQSEPGVLTLYAMYEKAHPGHVTVLEIYANKEAYQLHLKTPHFLRYKSGTLKMVKSLELIDVDPIAFGTKPNLLEAQKE
jgi:quinol monooxygenase YgiN